MSITAYTKTDIEKWDEDRSLKDVPRVTPATVAFNLPEIEGKATTNYLFTYTPDGNASFVYTETITVENFHADKKKGSFITQGKGVYDSTAHAATGTFEIVEGTGTGDLKGIKGKGTLVGTPTHGYHFEVSF
jgi:Protein of unknown function (DUF3224)